MKNYNKKLIFGYIIIIIILSALIITRAAGSTSHIPSISFGYNSENNNRVTQSEKMMSFLATVSNKTSDIGDVLVDTIIDSVKPSAFKISIKTLLFFVGFMLAIYIIYLVIKPTKNDSVIDNDCLDSEDKLCYKGEDDDEDNEE